MKNAYCLFVLAVLTGFFSSGQVANQISDQEYCGDPFTITIDLTTFDDDILGNQNPNDFFVSYYGSQMDADNAANPLANPYNLSSSQEIIFARVEDVNNPNLFDTTSFQIFVSPFPTLNISGRMEICTSGSSTTTIIDSGLPGNTYTFEWSRDNTILAPTTSTLLIDQAGNYTITATKIDASSCVDSDSFTITEVSCPDDDNDNVADFDEDVNSNGNLDDDDTDGDGTPNYQDDDDDGDMVLTLAEDYNGNGDPTDDDTDNSGVADYLEMAVALSEESIENATFSIYPNPTRGLLHIKTSEPISRITVLDLLGKQVKSTRSNIAIESTYSLAGLQPGIYFLQIESQGVVDIKKVVLK